MTNHFYASLSQLERLAPELLHIILSSTSLNNLYLLIRASYLVCRLSPVESIYPIEGLCQ